MKIAITCPYDMSHPGGVEEIVVNVSKRLKKKGIITKIITVKPEHDIDLEDVVFFGTPFYGNSNGASTNIDIESLEDDAKLAEYLEREKFDVICVESPDDPFLNWEVLAHSKTKNVGWFHSTSFDDLDSFPYNLVTTPLDSFLLSKLNGLIAASPTVVKTWDKIFDSRDKLILPAGTDVAKFDNAKGKKLGPQANILFVGRLDERKGVMEAIKAFNQVAPKVNSKLWIIGRGEQRDQAGELTKKLKLENKIEFLGFVPDEDLPAYYKSADIYLAPSLGGESVGIVLLDAMAAGVPIVAYDNVGYRFTLTGTPWNGSLIEIGRHKKLAEAMIEILNNNSLRKQVINWQKEKVKEFDWEVVTDKFLDYISKL